MIGTRGGVFRRLGSLLHADPLPAWQAGTLQKVQELHFRGFEPVFTLLVVVPKIHRTFVQTSILSHRNRSAFSNCVLLIFFLLYIVHRVFAF